MKMLSLVLILYGNTAWAVDLSRLNDFNQNWSYSPTHTRTDKNSVIKIKMFKRYLWINQHPIQISEANFTFLKNPQEKIDLKNLSEKIIKSFPHKILNAHQISNGIEISGNWKKMNRFIKIDLIKKENNFIIVTSFTRAGLAKAMMPELNQLHSFLKTYTENGNQKSTTFINFLLPQANAQEFSVPSLNTIFNNANMTTGPSSNNLMPAGNPLTLGGNPLGLGNSSLGTINGTMTLNTSSEINKNWSGTNGALNGLGNNVENLNNNLANGIGVLDKQGSDLNNNLANGIGVLDKQSSDLNNNVTNGISVFDKQGNAANKNWGKTNGILDKQGNAANKNWEKTNDIIDKQGTDANKNWDKSNKNWEKTNEIMDRQGTDANKNWAETNKLTAKLVDTNYLLKMAYYTAAGAALGSITMNLALEGVTAGISYLYELFTGERKKQLEWQDFQQAMQVWDTQLNDLVKMEQIVDEFILAFAFFGDKNISNDYIQNLTYVMRDMRFDRDILMEQFKNEDLTLSCRHLIYNTADEIDQKLKEYDKIILFSNKNNISTDKNQNYFCQQLKELQRKILSAETQMQDLRLAILKAESQFYEKNLDSRDKRKDNADQINDNINDTIENREDYNESSDEVLTEAFEVERDTWVSSCVEAENKEGIKIKNDIDNRFVHFFVAKGQCKTAFDKTHSIKDRKVIGQKIFKEENKLRQKLTINNNDKIDIALSDEQMNWLTRLHMDAYCYQFAHENPSDIPIKCIKFPELLYSMNMSKGYDKANKAYENKCEDRYLSGLQKLTEVQK